MIRRSYRAIILISGMLIGWTSASHATTSVFFDKTSWLAALSASSLGPASDFSFNAANLALSDELAGAPAVNDLLGLSLNFAAANTGLPSDFSVVVGPTENSSDPARELIFVSSGLGVATFTGAEHDWDVLLPVASNVFALGITVSGGGVFNDGLAFLDENDTNLALFEPNGDPFFAGIITDGPISRFAYEDSNISGGLVISELSLAVSLDGTTDVPEPGSLAVFGLSLAGLMLVRRRRSRGYRRISGL